MSNTVEKMNQEQFSPNAEELNRLRGFIKPIEIAMLTTRCDDGTLHSRPMQTQKCDFDGKSLWFFTTKSSPKCQEVKRDNHVNVSFSDPNSNTYVSIIGSGELVRDKKKMEELWSPSMKAWFPKELDEPDLALLKVNICGAEYWDSSKSSMVKLFGMAKSFMTGEAYNPSLEENKKLDMSQGRAVTA